MNNNNKLNDILIKRKNRRKQWSNSNRLNYILFLDNLKIAHNNMVRVIRYEIICKSLYVMNKNPLSRGFNMINPQDIECDIKNFKPLTILNGFWNKKLNKWNRIQHFEAQIKFNPIKEISLELKKHGISVYDISDRNKSNKTYIRVFIDKKLKVFDLFKLLNKYM